MLKVEVYDKGKQLATHWYQDESQAENCAYALHNHRLFKYRTIITQVPNAKVVYNSSKI